MKSTFSICLDLWGHLSNRRRLQLYLLLAVMLLSGLVELVSLGSVLPFLAVLTDPQVIWNQPLVQELSGFFGLTAADQLVLPSTLLFVFATIFAASIRLANLWINSRLSAAIGSDLSVEVYRRTLYQPYEVHLQHNSSDVITNITTQIGFTVGALNAIMQLITASLISLSLIFGLMLIDWQVATIAIFLFGSAYGILAFSTHQELFNNGRKIVDISSQQIRALQEGLGAIRDVLLDGNQITYLNIYSNADRPLRVMQAKNSFLASFPRYALEALGMVSIALLGSVLVLQRGSGAAVVPVLGAIALGAQRLLPALQQIYGGWASLKGAYSGVSGVNRILNQSPPAVTKNHNLFSFKNSIKLQSVTFKYSSSLSNALTNIDLEIFKGERIGFIGTTGSGKSTIIDLLMGLLKPTSGQLFIDQQDFYDKNNSLQIEEWRNLIAHVPQSIFLADSTISENIAFGVPKHLIDMKNVRRAAHKAQIISFIESMPHGFESFVGERGIRLSGGQRQRIGIARALYKNADIIIFDEATSALDNATEKCLMNSLYELDKELTILMIAHRLSTIEQCNRVIRLENGRIIADGPPDIVIKETDRS